jgi:hypothetical protein
MSFLVRWSEPSGPKEETLATAKTAIDRYVELFGKGYTGLAVRSDAGRSLGADDLLRLIGRDAKRQVTEDDTGRRSSVSEKEIFPHIAFSHSEPATLAHPGE